MARKKQKSSMKRKMRKKVARVMREYEEGVLTIGKSDKPVKKKKQAIAIALSEARSLKKRNKRKK
jgi:hypothetical protein